MRVFLSSTVFDLIDVRCEVDALLRELGVSPVLSDHKLSEFNLAIDANSIETCLLNVESSDAVIVVLDQRYGPLLGEYGFDDVSATHLEYRHAQKHHKPIYFYVRDRLEADFHIHHKNKNKKEVTYSWVSSKDLGLFEFLGEHRKLRRGSHANNWFSLFTSSCDLKESIRKHFEPAIKPRVLLDAIQQNRFPLFTRELDADHQTFGNVPSIKCFLRLKNIGLTPAFDCSIHWQYEDHKQEIIELVAPGQEIVSTIFFNLRFGREFDVVLKLAYRSAIGVKVQEKYRVYVLIQAGMSPVIISGATLIDRTYHHAPIPTLKIRES